MVRRALSLLSGSGYTTVLNDRFTGGYITRHYGRPAENIHAMQLELTWHNYMDEVTFDYLPGRADRLKQHLRSLLQLLLDWAEGRTAG